MMIEFVIKSVNDVKGDAAFGAHAVIGRCGSAGPLPRVQQPCGRITESLWLQQLEKRL